MDTYHSESSANISFWMCMISGEPYRVAPTNLNASSTWFSVHYFWLLDDGESVLNPNFLFTLHSNQHFGWLQSSRNGLEARAERKRTTDGRNDPLVMHFLFHMAKLSITFASRKLDFWRVQFSGILLFIIFSPSTHFLYCLISPFV